MPNNVQGEPYSRTVGTRIGTYAADQATLKARPLYDDCRADGAITALSDFSLWQFDIDSTAAASATVLVPTSGSGRWHCVVPAGGVAGGSSYKAPVRLATLGALAAYTRVGNIITANANGALGNIDSVAVVAGDRVLLTSNGTASDVDNGIYVATSIGSAGTPWVFTRADDANADGEIVGGMLVAVQAGTQYGGEWFACTNSAAITVNTTAITFVQVPNYVDLASTASGEGAALIGVQDAAGRYAGATGEAVFTDLGARIALAFADTTAQTAYAAAARANGQLAVVLDDDAGAHADYSLWMFSTTSVAGASDYVRVPDAGTGRWLRVLPTVAELSSNATALGASIVGLEDAGSLITATTVEGAAAEFAGDIDNLSPGAPMQNRLRLLGAPGAAVEGNTVTIGVDVYEFRSSTPPAGGTAGRIWVYNGANSAASRTNLIDAINGVVDANRITYDGAVTENFLAAAGITTGDVVIRSADAPGGSVVASATATATSDGLDTATDIWDAANVRFGRLPVARQMESVVVTLAAADIAKGTIDVWFTFTPTRCQIVNRSRPQDEAYTISGNAVTLTLAGGVGPNNQAGDLIDIVAFA